MRLRPGRRSSRWIRSAHSPQIPWVRCASASGGTIPRRRSHQAQTRNTVRTRQDGRWDPVNYAVRELVGLGDRRPVLSRWIRAQKSRLIRLHVRISWQSRQTPFWQSAWSPQELQRPKTIGATRGRGVVIGSRPAAGGQTRAGAPLIGTGSLAPARGTRTAEDSLPRAGKLRRPGSPMIVTALLGQRRSKLRALSSMGPAFLAVSPMGAEVLAVHERSPPSHSPRCCTERNSACRCLHTTRSRRSGSRTSNP